VNVLSRSEINKLKLIAAWGSLIVAVGVTTHFYLWKRLVSDPGWPAEWQTAGSAAIIALGLGFPVVYPLTLKFGPVAPRVVVQGIYGWLGAGYFVLLAFLALDLIGAFAEAAGAPLPLTARIRIAVAGLAGGSVALYAFLQARRGPVLERVVVRLANLPAALTGLRILQISDVHIGALAPVGYLAQVLDRYGTLSPHVIALTGDLIEERVANYRHELAPLAKLNPPLGVYFITGNHDYYAGVSNVIAELDRLGVTVLRNERKRLTWGGAQFDLCGVDDPTGDAYEGHGPDYEKALGGCGEFPVILLAHDPRSIRHTARYAVDLQLSGHTHGGQLWPGKYVIGPFMKYMSGLYSISDRTQLYVSRGTGTIGLPMRLPGRSEVTLIELQPKT